MSDDNNGIDENTISKTEALVSESEAGLAEKKKLAIERAKKIEETQKRMEERRKAREERRKARQEERRRRELGLPPAPTPEPTPEPALEPAEPSSTTNGNTTLKISNSSLPSSSTTEEIITEEDKPINKEKIDSEDENTSTLHTTNSPKEGIKQLDEIEKLMAETEFICSEEMSKTNDNDDIISSFPPSSSLSFSSSSSEKNIIKDTLENKSVHGEDKSLEKIVEEEKKNTINEETIFNEKLIKVEEDKTIKVSTKKDIGKSSESKEESVSVTTKTSNDKEAPKTLNLEDLNNKELKGIAKLDQISRFSLPNSVSKDDWGHVMKKSASSDDEVKYTTKSPMAVSAIQKRESKSKQQTNFGAKSMAPSSTKRKIIPIRKRTMMDTTVKSISVDPLQQETYKCFYKQGDLSIEIECPNTHSANNIKSDLIEKTTKLGGGESGLNVADYILLIPGANYYLLNETSAIHRLKIMQVCKKSFVYPRLHMVSRPDCPDTEPEELWNKKILAELNTNRTISELSGTQLKDILASDSDESKNFRKRIATVRNEVLKEIDAAQKKNSTKGRYDTSYLPQYRESEPMPPTVPPKIECLCTLPNATQMTKIVHCTGDQTAEQVRDMLFKKLRIVEPSARDKKVDDYLIKVTGYKEYFIGDHPIISYDYVRRSLSKKERIEFSLVPIEEVDLQIPEPVEDSFIDAILLGEAKQDRKRASVDKTASKDTNINVFDIKTNFGVTVELVTHVDTFRDIYNELQLLIKKKKAKALKKAELSAEETGVGSTFSLYVFGGLYHGGQLISTPIETSYTTYRDTAVWNQKLFTSLRYKDIPRATRLCFTLYMRQMDMDQDMRIKSKLEDAPLGCINIQLFNYNGMLLQGRHKFKLWPGAANPIGTTLENVASKLKKPVSEIQLMFEQFSTDADIFFPPWKHEIIPDKVGRSSETVPPVLRKDFTRIAKLDPLTPLCDEDRNLIWESREACANFPELLPRFLEATEWAKRKCVEECYRVLTLWKAPPGFDALQLLDAKYASPVVRAYAIKCMESLTDRECADFLLQLAQVLKYEPYHDSPLAEFLLRRALKNKNQIGHAFFWHLKAEMHNPVIASKYALLCEAYLRGCGSHINELAKQNNVLNELTAIALKIKHVSGSEERLTVLRDELRKVKFSKSTFGAFGLPLDPRVEVKGLIVDKCKYMDSKKLPLWLVFENAEKRGRPIYVIFKAGDDLRQDVLTLQMIRIMDKLWKSEGLDLRLNAYGCVATGDELGMIEVVLNASTTAGINKEAGGGKAVLLKDTLNNWLIKNNGEEGSLNYEKAVENFLYSCAGYCVATYVLGIGDRHNDNIMMTKMGHLFHIDFGHFLGNMKSKYGIKRERAPFIFNPQFAAILGGSRAELYTKFVNLCGRAYNILRKQRNMFINLFMMMLSTGIPELQSEQDLMYLKASLSPKLTDEEAAEQFAKLLTVARKTKSVLLNDIIHIWAHS